MDEMDPEQRPAKKIRYVAASLYTLSHPKSVDPSLLRSLQKVSHLLSSEVKAKYGLKSANVDSKPSQSEQPTTGLSVLNRPNGPNMMILNDDCLIELFAFLKPLDLANFAHVNVRLNKLVKRYIQEIQNTLCSKFQHDCKQSNGSHQFANFRSIFAYFW